MDDQFYVIFTSTPQLMLTKRHKNCTIRPKKNKQMFENSHRPGYIDIDLFLFIITIYITYFTNALRFKLGVEILG